MTRPARLLAVALTLMLAARLAALERINPPAWLEGRPGLSADLNFEPGPGGATRVELALGFLLADCPLPAGAAQPPHLRVRAEFEPAAGGKALARGGDADLGAWLKAQGVKAWRPAFSQGSRRRWQASIHADLYPGDWVCTVRLDDPSMGLLTLRSLRFGVPAMEPGKGLWMGDLRFAVSLTPGPDGPPAAEPNPWREAGGGSGLPLMAAYRLSWPPGWSGRGLSHRFVISGRDGDRSQAWQHEELRVLPPKGRASLESFEMPADELARLQPGRYLLMVQVWPQGDYQRRVTGYKAFDVPR